MEVYHKGKVITTLALLLSSGRVGVKYSRSAETLHNWGDALNAYLLPKISGKDVVHYSEYFNTGLRPTLSAIGSVLDNNRVRNLYVWGSGFKSGNSPLYVLPKKVFALRGHFSQKRMKSFGVDTPDVFGDPALTLPRFYQPPVVEKKFKVGIVLHYVDKAVLQLNGYFNQRDFTLIDVESPIEDFVNQLHACELVASSSLHGLIAADAYGISRVWLKLSDKIAGGDFKFNDYFSTTDCPEISPLSGDDCLNLEKLKSRAVQPQRIADIQRLLDAFPY